MTRIGSLTLNGNAWLAPMAGVSDVAFRVLCKRHGAAATPTEFLSANALAREEPRVIELTKTSPEEDIRIIQIFGQNHANIAKATTWIDSEKRFHGIDMNLGCPSPQILVQGACSALLRQPHKVEPILKAIIDNTNLPVSIKIRKGMTDNDDGGWKIMELAQDMGINHITIHARTVAQAYSGQADWEYIRKAKEHFDMPIIANGDITSGTTAVQCLAQTKADAVMVGRAARGNPFIFAEINAALNNQEYVPPTPQQKIQAFFSYLDLYTHYQMHDWSILKSHAMQCTKGLPGGAQLRQKIGMARTREELQQYIGECI